MRRCWWLERSTNAAVVQDSGEFNAQREMDRNERGGVGYGALLLNVEHSLGARLGAHNRYLCACVCVCVCMCVRARTRHESRTWQWQWQWVCACVNR
jgi:hypothetical protein